MSCSYCDQVCESDACIECRSIVRSIHDGINGWDYVFPDSSNQQKVRVTYIFQISLIGKAPHSVKHFTRDLKISPVVLRMMEMVMELDEDNNDDDDPMEMGEDNFRKASRKGLALNPVLQKFYDWEYFGIDVLPGEVLASVTEKYIAVDAVLL